MSTLDLDCWQHKLGMIEGCLRAYSAPQEVMAALAWMKQNLDEESEQQQATTRLDSLIDMPQKRQASAVKAPADSSPLHVEDVAKRKREAWDPKDEDAVAALLRSGTNIPSIQDKYPHRSYNSIYSLVNRLKSQGRV